MGLYKDNENVTLPSKKNKVEAARRIEFSLAEIDEMLKAWEKEETLFFSEQVIRSLFDDGTKGVSEKVEKEFLKVCIVNQIYGTNLYSEDILHIAKYLSRNADKINEKLYSEDVTAISDITCSIKDTIGKYCYSFATKYCSFAAPDEIKDSFPIYDSYMAILYKIRTDRWNPHNEKGFYKYYFDPWEGKSEHDAIRYTMYRKAVHMMQAELATVKKLTVKQLDQYLWKVMKEYSEKIN